MPTNRLEPKAVVLGIAVMVSLSACGVTFHDSDKDTDSSEWIPIKIPSVTLAQNEVEKTWVTIPVGSFVYGSPETQLCRKHSETQVEVVLTHPYKMASTEITREQWRMNGFPDSSSAAPCDKCAEGFVSWFDALAWLNALSRAVGLPECYNLENCVGDPTSGCPDDEYYKEMCVVDKDTHERLPQIFRCQGDVHWYPNRVDCPGYRLPTAAEWEWAARGGTTTATYNGELTVNTFGLSECVPDPVVDPIAWHLCDTALALHPVGELLPNNYGLYDVLGNASEWADYIHNGASLAENEGTAPPLIDPVGYLEDDDSPMRGLRGGSIAVESCLCTASVSGYDVADIRSLEIGFRPVRTIFNQ